MGERMAQQQLVGVKAMDQNSVRLWQDLLETLGEGHTRREGEDARVYLR